MGRKPKNSKIADKSHKQQSENLEVQVVKHPKVLSEKKVKKSTLPARRSGRLQAAIVATENHHIEQIIEDITVSESEKENEHTEDEFPKPPSMDDKDIHHKIDYLVELIRAQQKTINELNSGRFGKSSVFGESSGVGEVTYKSLYLDSQKKTEALIEENNQLSKKLEYAHGKIEIYEKGDHVSYEMLEKVKDVLFCSDGTRSTEAAAEGALECKSPKRKRGPN